MTLIPKWMTATKSRLAEAHEQQDQARAQRDHARAVAARAEMTAAESSGRLKRNHISIALDQLWTKGHNA